MSLHKFIIFYMEKFILLIIITIGPLIFKGNEELSLNYETQNTVFHEIRDTSDVMHWYTEIRNGDIYCHRHSTWEHMEIKNSASIP